MISLDFRKLRSRENKLFHLSIFYRHNISKYRYHHLIEVDTVNCGLVSDSAFAFISREIVFFLSVLVLIQFHRVLLFHKLKSLHLVSYL